MHQITSHDEAHERHGVQGNGRQTGAPAAGAGVMLVKGLAPTNSVFAPEQIDAAPFLEPMTALGTPSGVIDLPPDEELAV